LEGGDECSDTFRFTPDGKNIFASKNSAISIWETAQGTKVKLKFTGHHRSNYQDDDLTTISFSENG
jgi:hypothetical protein